MNATRTALCALLAGLLLQGISGAALGAACAAAASTAWNVQTTWGAAGTGCAGAPGGIPGPVDTVSIGVTGAARAVTIPAGYTAQAASIAIGAAAINGPSSLTLSTATSVLSVGGAVTLASPGNNNTTNALNVNAGSATMASITITGGNGNRAAQLAISTGTATVTGNVSFAGTAANARITFSSTGTLRIGGTFGNGGTFTASTGTVEYNGGGAQTVNNTYSYNHLTINKGGGSTATLGGNTTVGGNLTVTAGILDLSTFTANRTAGGGTISVANGATLRIGGTNTFPTNYTTHTLGATSTVEYNGTNQSVAAEGAPGYGHLILSGSGTKTAAGSYTVRGNLSITGVTFAGTTFTQTVNGSVSNTGTHTATSGRILLSGGAAAHALSGTGTYANLELNDANGATLSASPTVSGTLTLTSGILSTGANTLITSANCPGSVSRTGGHVAGFLRLRIPGPATCTFHVGDGTTYRPIVATFNTGTTAGDLTGSVTQAGGDHPNIGTSALDATQSVNRYWTFTNNGVGLSASGYDATFNFVAGDRDGGADPLQFEAERWDGAAWNAPTVGARTSTSTQATGITAFGDFALGEKIAGLPTSGSFNAFETSTAAAAITGVIRTKVAGSAFGLDVVAIASGARQNGFTSAVIVELLGNNTLGVPLDAQNCPTSFTLVQTVAPDPAITGGRSTVNFAAVADSWRDVRVRVRWPTTSPTVTRCSTNNFAIRPNTFASFAVSDADWETAGTGRALNDVAFGTATHKAGRPFSVRATAVNAAGTPATTTNYAGAPTATPPAACAGAACTATFGALTLATTFAAGQLASDVASYDNVGSFRLELVDASFASVDAGDSSALEREIRSATIDVGRFVPDHFAVALNLPSAPEFSTACGSFTYIGQKFNYTLLPSPKLPVITVTAQGFANNTTTLYAGSWWRITNASLTGKAYTAAVGTLDTTGLPGTDPVIASSGAGVGTLTFGSGTGLFFTRTTPTAPASPYDADISLAINVIDADGVPYATNPARFGQATAGNGIAFSAGKPMRFGRLRLDNAVGSGNLDLPIPIQTQYWTGTGFQTNTADNCTSLSSANIGFSNYFGGISAVNMNSANISGLGGPFASGVGSLTLTKPLPAPGSPGAVTLTVNLTAEAKSYLKGNWGVPTFTADPTSRAAFGLFGSQPKNFIFFRENY